MNVEDDKSHKYAFSATQITGQFACASTRLIGRALEQYGSLGAIPCTAFVEDITSYKLKRRR